MIASSVVDWGALGNVVITAFVAGVIVTVSFSCTILGAVGYAERRRAGRTLEAGGYAALSLLAAAVCLAAVAGGIVAMTSK